MPVIKNGIKSIDNVNRSQIDVGMKDIKLFNEAIDAVYDERQAQKTLYGRQRLSYGDWLKILIEEVGEVAQAMQQDEHWSREEDASDLFNELIQVAAVSISIAEQVLEEMESVK